MANFISAFLLGNSAILGNVCLLPLYPGLLAFLTGQLEDETQSDSATNWLGLIVLAGVITMMLTVGLVLYLLRQPFSTMMPYILPPLYGMVVLLGLVMLFGFNPFSKIQTIQAPFAQNPYVTAYLYGLLLAPMTLPCTGPLIISTFVLGVGSIESLINELLFFAVFGLGFGWPLVLMPLVTTTAQNHFVRWMTKHHQWITRLSGVLLMAVGIWGIWIEVLPIL